MLWFILTGVFIVIGGVALLIAGNWVGLLAIPGAILAVVGAVRASLSSDAKPGACGERTPRQRLFTYSFFLALSLICTVLWWTGIVEGATGTARLGEVIFPVAAVFFAVRVWREFTSRHRP